MDPIPEQYKGFEEVFEKAEFDTLPLKQPWDHAIELKPGSEPAGCKVYPLNLNEQKNSTLSLKNTFVPDKRFLYTSTTFSFLPTTWMNIINSFTRFYSSSAPTNSI